jgi:hypothetical protein
MPPTLHAFALQSLADQLADLLSSQVADLREFARATTEGEGTIQLEKNLRSLELRRAELYRQFEKAVSVAMPKTSVVSADRES